MPEINARAFTVNMQDAPVRLDRFLSGKLSAEFSRTRLQKRIREEGVLKNKLKVSDPACLLAIGDTVEVRWSEVAQSTLAGETLPFEIVYEDDDLLLVNKPRGMTVHPAPHERSGTLVHALLGSRKNLADVPESDRPGIVHRLDKDASGLILVAKNARTLAHLRRQFEERTVVKIYDCLVEGRVDFEEGSIESPIGRDPRSFRKMAVRSDEKGKEALTRYKTVRRYASATHVRVRIYTGRTHQIRVHFKSIGHPVLGDPLYGAKKAPIMALQASEIEFEHPRLKKKMKFRIPLAEDFKALLEVQ